MRRLALFALLPLLAGCAWFRDPPRSEISTGATVVYNGGPGGELFSVCDRGNLVYLTKSQPAVYVVKDGCNPQATHDTAAQVAAWRALAERRGEVPTQPEPKAQAQPAPVPQPLLVQLVPTAPPVESRAVEPVVIQVQPAPVCPACPVYVPSPPPAVARPAPKPTPAKGYALAQLDPNTASIEDLERLPGISQKGAEAIKTGRPYKTLHELVDKKVLSEADFKFAAPYLVIR